jgi:hypothetical protein
VLIPVLMLKRRFDIVEGSRAPSTTSSSTDRAWDLNSVFYTAAQFPQLCQNSTEIHSAVLTRYTTFPSFVKLSAELPVVSYKNAELYSSKLLSDLLNYKQQLKLVDVIFQNAKQYVKTEVDDAFDPTPNGLDLAQREIEHQLAKIVEEVDSVNMDPNVAVETAGKRRVAYINPRVLASRLPARSQSSSFPVNSDTKPASALPPPPRVESEAALPTLETSTLVPLSNVLLPQEIATEIAVHSTSADVDPKTWQWVYVPGVDSYGNNIFAHGDGHASPEEIMIRINEWEAENPGEIVRGFDLKGRVKSKIYLRSAILPPQPSLGLYIRVLYDDAWTFVAGANCQSLLVCCTNPMSCGSLNGDVGIVERIEKHSGTSATAAFDSAGGQNSVGWVYPHGGFAKHPFLGAWVRRPKVG